MVSTKNRWTPCRSLEEAGRWVRRTVTAETQNDPALYREAIDELVAAIQLLMRNSAERPD